MARLRRYAAPLYIDLKKTVVTHLPNGEDEEEEEEYPKIFIGEASLNWPLSASPCCMRCKRQAFQGGLVSPHCLSTCHASWESCWWWGGLCTWVVADC